MAVEFCGREIGAAIFDLGDTLISIDPPISAIDAAFAEIAELLTSQGYDPVPGGARLRTAVGDFVDEVIAQPTPDDREVDHRELAADAYRRLGLELSDQTLTTVMAIEQRAWHDSVRLAPGALEVLAELRRRGLRLGICSNAPYDPASMKTLLARLDLTRHVDEVVLSTDSGFRKPSPQMFLFALRALDVTARKAVFIGDKRYQDVDGARAAGMLTIRVRGVNDDRAGNGSDADAVVDNLAEILNLFHETYSESAGTAGI